MGLHDKLLVIGVFLLSTLGSCRAKNATVEVAGLMLCTDCINNQSSTSNSSLGFEVLISCNANEMRAQGNGGVDEHGKFNVTLSAEITEDAGAAYGCYAKLQSRSGAPCRIQAPQTASVKIQSNSATAQLVNRPTVIKFSPITCQSAFFWPFPNLTFFGSSPPAPPEYTAPPAPAASPAQPPLGNATPPPSDIEAPSPLPTYQNPTNPPPEAQPPQPSSPVYSRPSSPPLPAEAAAAPLNAPTQSPKQTPPIAAAAPPTPAPSAGISIAPRRRRPSPIPKAPPIPRLPLTPSVPRKYFNPPKSISKPPRSL